MPHERCRLPIGGDVYVIASAWLNSRIHVHIREYNRDAERCYPTKRGIRMNLMQWQDLVSQTKVIDETIATLKSGVDAQIALHLGANMYVTADKKCKGVDIRQWWKDENDERENVKDEQDDVKDETSKYDRHRELKPSKKGIFLHLHQWETLKMAFLAVDFHVPELKDTVPCIQSEDHQNQEGMLKCSFCNPDDWKNW